MSYEGVTKYTTLTHPNLSIVRHKTGVTKPREWKSLNFRVDDSLGVTNNDIDTAQCALMERLFYFCKHGTVENRLPTTKDNISMMLKPFKMAFKKYSFRSAKMTNEEFISTYQGRLKTRYEQAMEDYTSGGVKRKHAVSKFFVKFEKVRNDKAPRGIQPRDPIYNFGLGKFIKPVEKRIYRAIKKLWGIEPVVLKGFNVTQTGNIMYTKWNHFKDPVAIGMDASRFDMHVTAEMLAWEHDFYLEIYNNDPELAKLLGWQIDNKGVCYCVDGTIRYTIWGARFSGDMNTSLGNCLIMCAMIYSYFHHKNINVKLANNGDDCVVFMERNDMDSLSDVPSFFKCLGFRMEVEPYVDVFERIEFCQMHPIQVGDDYVMCRNWKTSLNKDSMCIKPLASIKGLRKWMYCVGECGIRTYGNMPVLGEFYRKYMEYGIKNQKMKNDMCFQSGMMKYWSKGVDWSNQPIGEDTRYSFFLAFGVSPDEQLAIELELSSVSLNFKLNDTETFRFDEF